MRTPLRFASRLGAVLATCLVLAGSAAGQCYEQNYCQVTANSTGSPAILGSNGNCAIGDNVFQLTATPVPNKFGIFIYSAGAPPNGNGFPLGNGYLCVGDGTTPIFRLGVTLAQNGVLTRDLDFNDLPLGGEITAGTTWYFQAWFRDPAGGGSKYNLSNGLAVTFQAELTPSVDFEIASQNVGEGDGSALLTVNLSSASGLDVTVPYSVGGSATDPDDFTLAPDPLVIPAGDLSASIVLTIVDDFDPEADETVIVTLQPPTNAQLGSSTVHTATIRDDDSLPTVEFALAAQNAGEADGGASALVVLSAVSGLDVTVPFSVTGGDATDPDDYSVTTPTPITILAGQLSAPIDATLVSDLLDELDETVVLTLGPPTNAALGTIDEHTLTILDDDDPPVVEFTLASQSAGEASGAASATLALSAPSGLDVSVPFAASGSAADPDDYSIPTATPVTILAGQLSAPIDATLVGDLLDELNETVVLTLGPPTNATLGTVDVHTLTIVDDDDPPVVQFALPTQSAGEGAGSASAFVSLSVPSGLDVSVPFSVTGGDALDPDDYSLATATPLTIPAGSLSVPIDATLVGDLLDELDETVVLTLGPPVNATLGATDAHTLTIVDDDDPPVVQFAVAAQSVGEASGGASASVVLSVPSGLDVSVPFSVTGGDATDPDDYSVTTPSPLTIPAGALSFPVDATLVGDLLDEADETVVLTLGPPTNATLGATDEHTLTIVDDDDPPIVQFVAGAQSAGEAAGAVSAMLTLSTPSGRDVMVPFSVTGGDATDPDDYSLTTASPVTILAGALSAPIDATLVGDLLDELDETVVVTLGPPTNATLGTVDAHTLTILDDDDPPVVEFALASQSAGEADGTASAMLTLTAPSGLDVSVPFSVTSGDASDPEDYSLASTNPLTIPAGALSAPLDATLVGDLLDELDETFELTLGPPTNATLGQGVAHVVTIVDDDDPPAVDFSTAGQTVSESAGTALATVQLSAVSGLDVTVPFTVAGDAIDPDDYSMLTGSPLMIPAGTSSVDIEMSLFDDSMDEPNETIELTLGAPTNGSLGLTFQQTVLVSDDDLAPTVEFSLASQSVNESAGSAVAVVQLSGVSGLNVTVPFSVTGGAAIDPDDYSVVTSSPVMIPAGQLTTNVDLTVVSDVLDELDEDVVLTLGPPTNAGLGGVTDHTLTILDDDLPPVVQFAIPSQSIDENGLAALIDVDLSVISALDVTIPYTTSGSATEGVDYSLDMPPLVIPAGGLTGQLTLTPTDDGDSEGTEVATVTLGNPTNATLGAVIAHDVTIVDDDCSVPSQDFNDCAGLVDGWTYVDPIGDGSFAVTGVGTDDAWALLTVPGGSNHVPFGSVLPGRIVRPLCDGDLEFQVKFESALTLNTQIQGVTVEQDNQNWLRADFFASGGGVRIFVGSTIGGTTTQEADVAAPGAGVPSFLQVSRTGDDWTVSWSTDGVTYNPVVTFPLVLTASQVSIYAGNAGGAGARAHTAAVDWFQNTAQPFVTEDGPFPGSGPFFLTTNVTGNGTVDVSPDLPSYTCSDVVTLTATPDPGWTFDQWMGDVTGSQNPVQLDMSADRSVTAVFITDVDPPVISNVQVSPSATTATITWDTDEPATSRVEYGLTAGYGSVEEDLTLVTSHIVLLTGLTPAETYHFRVCSTDGNNNTACSGDATFQTLDLSGLVSDDFNKCEGLSAPWTFLNPFMDASSEFVTGVGTDDAWLNLSVPGGSNHDPFNNVLPPRVVQPVNDADFQYQVKFESNVAATIQQQGTIIEEDQLDWIRFDIYRTGGNTRAFVGNTVNGSTATIANVNVTGGAPMFLQVTRLGDQWTMQHSRDPQSLGWTTIASFSRVLVPTQIALYGGNSGGSNAPAHTAQVDWFQDTAAPLGTEDGPFAGSGPFFLTLNTTGDGSVVKDPDQADYSCTDVVTLTAAPDPGWQFSMWTGDVTGSANPVQVTMDDDKTVTAVFVPDTDPPIISNVQVFPSSTTALVTWDTDEPATSRVDFGLTTGYGMFVEDLTLVTSHAQVLSGLTEDTLYHFQITSADAGGLTSMTSDATFMTDPGSNAVSDDFNQCTGLGAQWTFVDPQADATLLVQGVSTDDAQLVITVPAGASHEAYDTIQAPHVLQTVNDVDFGLEAKFESDVLSAYQIQGFLIKEDDLNWLRFDFYHDGSNVIVYGGRTINGDTTEIGSVTVATGGEPLWMSVDRVGDQWTQKWSDDGVLWTTTIGGVTHAMTVTEVGLYAGNAVGASSPEHSMVVDYFFNVDDPISPEDGPFAGGGPFFLTTNVNPLNTGAIIANPDQVEYYCSDIVELTAVADPGYRFLNWGGDLMGTANPAFLPMNADHSVTAFFEVDLDPPIISNVQVNVGPTFATITWDTDEPATSVVDWGPTAGYGSQVSDGNLVTQHSVPLTGLTRDTLYHFMVTSCDNGSLCTSTSDMTFTTSGDGSLVSDDFNSHNLNLSVWEWVDPHGEATLHMNGVGTSDAFLELSVPQGTEYLPWITNDAARVLQVAQDTDLEMEVKFESILDSQYQSVGIIVEGDADTWMRFDFQHTGTSLRILYASFDLGANVDYGDTTIASGAWLGAPLYMRVRRLGDQWTQSYSFDGQVWFVNDAAFTFPIPVSKVGPMVANEAPLTNATTAVVDYFFTTTAPIDPEDFGSPADATSPYLYRTTGRPASESSIRAEWFTDEMATGSVIWGMSAGNYSFGPQQGDPLVHDGFTVVTGLTPDTDYHFQVTVDDENGNPVAQSADFVLRTGPPGFDGLPNFDVWYGQPDAFGDKVLRFGQVGRPQRWANVLGLVTDDFGAIVSLTYSLNGGPTMPLEVGDGVFGSSPLRLVQLGEFNAEIDCDDLLDDSIGLNEVTLTATDNDGNVVVETVWIDFDDGNVWPSTFDIDWNTVVDLQDVVQVVDGEWEIWDFNGTEPPRLRTSRSGDARHGYDRLVCLGDLLWSDFEFQFEFEIHELNPLGFTPASNSHAFGVIARWPGHVARPPFEQPHNGFWPFGGLAAYRWYSPSNERWNAYHMGDNGVKNPNILLGKFVEQVHEGVSYHFKGQCDTQPDGTTIYRTRIWEVGDAEPGTWFLEMTVNAGEQATGSLLLIANDVDVSIGNISVTPTLGN